MVDINPKRVALHVEASTSAPYFRLCTTFATFVVNVIKIRTRTIRYSYSNRDCVQIKFVMLTSSGIQERPLCFRAIKLLPSSEKAFIGTLFSEIHFSCSPSFSLLSAPGPMAASSSPTSYYPFSRARPISHSPPPLQPSPLSSNSHSSSSSPPAWYFPYSYLASAPLSLVKQGAVDNRACSDRLWLRLQSVPLPALERAFRAKPFESALRDRSVSAARL